MNNSAKRCTLAGFDPILIEASLIHSREVAWWLSTQGRRRAPYADQYDENNPMNAASQMPTRFSRYVADVSR